MKYPARFFDGKSARPYQVQVEVTRQGLNIHLEDDQQVVFWEKESIREVMANSTTVNRIHHQDGALLEVEDPDFLKTIRITFPEQAGQSIADRLSAMKWQTMVSIVVIVGVAVFLLAWTVIPWMGEQAAGYVPQSYEEDLGESIYEAMLPGMEVDSQRTELLEQMVRRADFKSGYPLRFVVVKDEQKNAFALPGGRIVVYSGILEVMKGHAELMGLLSHEVSHVNHRHSLRAIFRQLSTYLFVSLIFNDLSAVSSIVVDQAQQLQSLSYSRELEKEADLEGLELMIYNRFDPMGMPNLFKNMLEKEDEFTGSIPEFLSTHPVSTERIDYLKKEIKRNNYQVADHAELDEAWEKLKSLPKEEKPED
jgi:beta-barrel assembly-enhancing protease